LNTSWRTRWLLAPLALAILQATGATAAADTEVKMSLPGSHGYQIEIESFTRSVFGRFVELKATKKVGEGAVYATYTVHGKATADRVDADFGDVGHLSLKFKPAPRQRDGRPPSRACRGRLVHLRGQFVGTIRFRGELGFSSVSATRAKGSTTRFCATTRRGADRANTASREPVFVETELGAASRSGGRTVTLLDEAFTRLKANGEPVSEAGNTLSVGLEEKRGRMEIDRSALIFREPMTVSPLGTVPLTASLAPPAPFSGTVSYREEPGTPPSWTGDLSVDLPGAADVPLAGPDFQAILCSGKSTDGKLRQCRKKLLDLLVP
jgi:hypothetical protein